MTSSATPARAMFSIERSYAASIDECWALWTTKAGIESWWGPEGFAVTVTAIDLRPGGTLAYLMTATAPDTIAFMTQAGMPLSTPCTITYTDVAAPTRLTWTTRTDFVPGVEPYDVATIVELRATPDGTAIVIHFDAMHDDIWTDRARAGHESQLRKLDALLATGNPAAK